MTSAVIGFPFGLASSAVPRSGGELERDAERDAIAACQRGEREAFDVLVERYQRAVYRLCYRHVNNHEDANDLAQEAFLKAWRAIHGFRGDSAFSTWLYRIAVNACLNFRARRRPETREVDDAIVDPRPGADWHVEREDDAGRVREAVSRLPDRQRATLILKLFHDLTHEEVAGILGSSVGTVKANLFHALANLRRAMAESGAGALVTTHVPDDAVVDLALGAGLAAERAHLGACAACAGRVEEALAALELARRAEVPEPSPLYWPALRRGVRQRIAEEGRPASRFVFLFPLAAAAAVVVAVLLARPEPKRVGTAEPRLAAWSALPAEEDDEGLLVLEGLALTSGAFTEWDRPAGLGDYLSRLTDDESRALAESLGEAGQGGDS